MCPLLYTNTTLEYNNYSPMKYLLKKIYTEVLLTEEFKSISSEIFNIDEIKNFFKNIEGYDGGKINKIYFYNINIEKLINELAKNMGKSGVSIK